jgi:thiosulfate dehydrogenase
LRPLQRAEAADAPQTWPFSVPAESTIPAGPLGEAIKLGQKVVTDTQSQAKAYVGNGLNCSSCHLNGGTVAGAAPFVGLWGVFPEYRSRSASVNALQARINDCFERSMNGKALPEESPEMIGVLSYVWWLSQGVPTGMDSAGRGFKKILAPATPDKARGKSIYAQKCASCHAADGAGLNKPDGSYMFPALWGPKAFNIGAGMARLEHGGSVCESQHAARSGRHALRSGSLRRRRLLHHASAPRPCRQGKRLAQRRQTEGRALLMPLAGPKQALRQAAPKRL